MQGQNSKLYILFAVMVSLLFAASALNAQETQGGQQGQGQGQYKQQQPQDNDFSKDQIEAFVSARAEVDELRKEFQPKFQEADDVDQAQELREEFQNKAINILDNEGLDVQTYNSIVKGMDKNKELRDEIQKKMSE
ncbi:MAG: DUF4168 domain-containing protein [Desulfovermiculus sp.]|nr:DUF4168 domain-containing protein [Desulfovermiculus sp.]